MKTVIATVRMPSSISSDTASARIADIGSSSRGNHTRVIKPPAFTIVPIDVVSEAAKKFHGSTPASRKKAKMSMPLGSPGSGVILK